MTVKEEIQGLIDLQKIDHRLHEIEGQRKELLAAILKVRDPLTQLEKKRDDLISQVSELRNQMRQIEVTIQEDSDKAEKSKEKLPLITTQKEYFALQKEIEIMERNKNRLEEELLQKMGTFEELQKEKDETVSMVETEKENFLKKKEEMESANVQFDTEFGELTEKKEKVTREIGPRSLGHYNNVLTYQGTPAVVQIIDGNCQGCHMNLPPQLFNDVRKGESVMTCSYCNRILFAKA
jgi:predicted  nucleic acid-binding Zn-ribbon protein